MYLADSLKIATEGLPPDHPFLMAEGVRYLRRRCLRVLSDFELMTFTPSALAVAADIRIDTPARLEGIGQAVFEAPRRVFVEARQSDRRSGLSQVRGFPQTHLRSGRTDPERVGLEIESFGKGRGRIGVLWSMPRTAALAEMQGMPRLPGSRLQREAELELMRLGVGYAWIDVDLSQSSGMTFEVFEREVQAGTLDAAACLAAVDDFTSQWASPPTGSARLREAWRLHRLNEISSMTMDPGAAMAAHEAASLSGEALGGIVDHAERDLDGEIIYALAMLAAVEAGGDALESVVRESKPRRREKPKIGRDLGVERLAVLSMSISDRELVRAMSGETLSIDDASSGAERRPRVRHPVRGHLFKARNGRLVYRKPHWRGGRSARSITRVS